MNNVKEHFINTRALTTINSEQYAALPGREKNYLFDLSHLGIIELNGEKSIDFLQGQLTCDVKSVSDIQMIQGAQCNLKGRILSLLDIINWNGLKIVLPKDLTQATLHSLTKTAQLSKITLKENFEFKILGFYLQNPKDILPDSLFFSHDLYALTYSSNYCYYHLGKGFYIFIVQKDKAMTLCKTFIENNQFLGSLSWHTLRLLEHQIDIYPESRGLFQPHRLSLHETSYINFNKGCYKGQEIIARTHYRATIKHELRICIISSKQKIYSGQRLFRSKENTELGEVIDYSILGNDRYLIALSILKEPILSARLEGHNEVALLEAPEFK